MQTHDIFYVQKNKNVCSDIFILNSKHFYSEHEEKEIQVLQQILRNVRLFMPIA